MSLFALSLAVVLWLAIAERGACQSNTPSATQLASDEPVLKSPESLAKVQQRIVEQLERVGPTVVSIAAGGGSGSGVIVSRDGLVLTAAHVIDKATDLTIIYPDGRRFKGKALGTYGPGDAGMAQITEGGPHPFAEVAPAESLSVGQTVFAMGHPGGFDIDRGAPIRIGHITEIDGNFISLDAALIGGDSGGPSFDLQGRVVGIHSHINDRVEVNRDGHIAAFHRAWQSMQQGVHDAEHYSRAVQTNPRDHHPKPESMRGPGTTTEAQERARRLQELVDKSKANDGKLKIDRNELQKMRQQIANQTDELAPTSGGRLIDSWASHWHQSLEPACRQFQSSVAKVICAGRHTALATVVSPAGHLVTKASEVKNRQFQIQLMDRTDNATNNEKTKLLTAQILAIDDALDLALMRVETSQTLAPINWSQSIHGVPKGTLCAALGTTLKPAGFGIVSVAERRLDGKSGAYLGVQIEPNQLGLKVTQFNPRSPARVAGLKNDDVILAVDGVKLSSSEQLSQIVSSMLPGDVLRLDIQREQTQLTISVRLADGNQLAPMPGNREQAMDSLTAKLSKRRWGFRMGLQHDCAIAANECGGPLVDLDGKLLGINIARTGRIQSFAVPIDEVQKFVQHGLAQGGAP